MEGLIGSIMLFAGNFAPRSWAFCHGQLLPISQNSALFSILGTTYGGDGRTTFALPDLRGRVAIQQGNGPGLSDYRLGAKGGVEHVTLNTTQIPSHNHLFQDPAYQFRFCDDATLADASADDYYIIPAAHARFTDNPTQGSLKVMGTETIQLKESGVVGNTGGNLSHENRQPFLALNYIICMQGIFPSRS